MFGLNKLGALGAPRGLVWNPTKLFKSSETGFWYDPSDLTTLFQDSAGTTPVTGVEQPVGLMLDKSAGASLGAELVTNGTFDGDASGWTLNAAWSYSDGKIAGDGATTFNAAVSTFGGTTTGKLYKISYTVSDFVSGGVRPQFTGGATVSFNFATANGVYEFYSVATQNHTGFQIQTGGAGFDGKVDNISVKEVAGQHATQATSANRPLLSARYNLQDRTECDGDSGGNGWVLVGTGTTIADRTDNISGPWEGTLKGVTVTGNGSDWHRINTVISRTFSNTKSYRVTWVWKLGTSNNCRLQIRDGVNAVESFLRDFDGTNFTVTENAGALTDITNEDIGNGVYVTSATFTPTFSSNQFTFGIGTQSATVGHTIIAYGVFCTEQQYADLPLQRVYDTLTTPSDYDSSNSFPKYLKFDGTDDYMVVNGLSAASGPITAHFGYVTDDGESVINQYLCDVETGRIAMMGVGSVAGQIGYFDGAFTEANINTEALSVATFNLNSTAGQVLVNGSEVISGVGQYTECALGGEIRIGSRFTAANYLDGNLYQAILRSTTSTTAEIDKAEAYINRKMGGVF